MVFVRAMVANRLASDGLTWTKLFKRHNSGTYNNQWLVINYSLFRPGHIMPKYGLLYVLEQMPGLIETRDVTKDFLDQTYWASYNVPFSPTIFQTSGQGDMVKRYGNWYAHIFICLYITHEMHIFTDISPSFYYLYSYMYFFFFFIVCI